MGSKEEFVAGLDADGVIPVGKPGALSAVEVEATRNWYDRERFAAGRGVHGVPDRDPSTTPAMGYTGHFFDVTLKIRVGPTESRETAEDRIRYILRLNMALVDGTWEFVRE